MNFHNAYVDNWYVGSNKRVPKTRNDKQRTIFLDIDGVIQPYNAQLRHEYDLDQLCSYLSEKYHNEIYQGMDKYDVGAAYYDWDTIALSRIRELSKRYNAGIVLHTGWCWFNNLEQMKALFALYGMDDFILGQVDGKKSKHEAVNEFLEAHPELEDYVVIDDDSFLKPHFGEHFILTYDVITEENCKKISERFKSQDIMQT